MTESVTTKNVEQSPEEVDLGIVLELGSIGAGHAATSLSEIFQEPISIEVPKIHTMPPHMVPSHYKKHDVPTTAVYMQLRGEAECDILLMFEVEEAKKIAAMMNMVESPDDVDPDMEASAIDELGNIVIGSFLTALSDFTGANLVPNPPERATDSFDAILDSFLIKQMLSSDMAMLFDTQFKRADGNISGILMMFPSRDLQRTLTEKAKSWVS
ncbi:MAG: chemotaxis protein CheC [Candidatus Bathyarchaeota archaeon]|nr:chemotaxis protein CheC [Candidatus Bathyarchaeota archaeon]